MKKNITLRSLLIIFLCNAFMIGFFYFLIQYYCFEEIHKWIGPESTYENVVSYLHKSERNVVLYLIIAGVGFTAMSWLLVSLFGNRLLAQSLKEVAGKTISPAKAGKKEKKKKSLAESLSNESTQRASLQTLVILQRKGRLIDFLQEDLSQHDDAQIGAAVRSIHAGCKETLSEHIDLKPIYKEEEGCEVTIPKGFDSKAIQLTGNVKGNPPFNGIIRHRGWRAVRVQMPQLTSQGDEGNIIAPAEVEIT